MPTAPRLLLVTNRRASKLPLPELAARAIAGGVDFVQVREKDLRVDELRHVVSAVVEAVGGPTRVMVNGDAALARELGTGLHLPDRDASRPLAGASPLSRSIHDPETAAALAGYDFAVAGHVYPTASKPEGPPLGLDGLRSIVAAAPVPIVAIGGMTPDRVAGVLATGAAGIAVMSAINDRDDPFAAARAFRLAIERHDMTEETANAIAVTINGKPVTLSEPMSIADYLKMRGHHDRMVVVELNGSIVRRPLFDATVIAAGDEVEVVHFVGGGTD